MLRSASVLFLATLFLVPGQSSRAGGLEDLENEAITMGPGIELPSMMSSMIPERPASVEGNVTVKALIDSRGEVREVEVLDASDKKLAKLAREIVLGRRYAPARRDGNPVTVWWKVTLQFHSAEGEIASILACDPTKVDASPPRAADASMQLPMLVRRVDPSVSSRMRKLGSGRVVLQCQIDVCGHVGSCEAVETTGPEYTECAKHAVLQWLYRPAIQDGKPIAIFYTVRVDFDIR